MRKVRISIGSNDGKNILSAHMGMAGYFYIYDIFKNGEVKYVEKRKNISPKEEKKKHGSCEKMKVIMKILKNVDIVVGRRTSPNFIKMAAESEYQPVIVDADKILEVTNILANHFNEIFSLVNQRRNGDREKKIPKFRK